MTEMPINVYTVGYHSLSNNNLVRSRKVYCILYFTDWNTTEKKIWSDVPKIYPTVSQSTK